MLKLNPIAAAAETYWRLVRLLPRILIFGGLVTAVIWAIKLPLFVSSGFVDAADVLAFKAVAPFAYIGEERAQLHVLLLNQLFNILAVSLVGAFVARGIVSRGTGMELRDRLGAFSGYFGALILLWGFALALLIPLSIVSVVVNFCLTAIGFEGSLDSAWSVGVFSGLSASVISYVASRFALTPPALATMGSGAWRSSLEIGKANAGRIASGLLLLWMSWGALAMGALWGAAQIVGLPVYLVPWHGIDDITNFGLNSLRSAEPAPAFYLAADVLDNLGAVLLTVYLAVCFRRFVLNKTDESSI